MGFSSSRQNGTSRIKGERVNHQQPNYPPVGKVTIVKTKTTQEVYMLNSPLSRVSGAISDRCTFGTFSNNTSLFPEKTMYNAQYVAFLSVNVPSSNSVNNMSRV